MTGPEPGARARTEYSSGMLSIYVSNFYSEIDDDDDIECLVGMKCYLS